MRGHVQIHQFASPREFRSTAGASRQCSGSGMLVETKAKAAGGGAGADGLRDVEHELATLDARGGTGIGGQTRADPGECRAAERQTLHVEPNSKSPFHEFSMRW